MRSFSLPLAVGPETYSEGKFRNVPSLYFFNRILYSAIRVNDDNNNVISWNVNLITMLPSKVLFMTIKINGTFIYLAPNKVKWDVYI